MYTKRFLYYSRKIYRMQSNFLQLSKPIPQVSDQSVNRKVISHIFLNISIPSIFSQFSSQCKLSRYSLIDITCYSRKRKCHGIYYCVDLYNQIGQIF